MADIKEVNVNIGGGKVSFSNEVISTIVARATENIDGVAAAAGNIVSGVTEFFGVKNPSKGVKVEVGEEEVAVDLNLSVKYGVNIPDVCAKVRKSVEEAVTNMTGLRVREININIANIVMDEK